MGLDVVVVDDEPDVLTYLAAVLEQRGHHPHAASDSSSGLALIRSIRPAVVCLDIVMPEETGVALYRRIRNDPELCHTPVIFITAMHTEPATPAGFFADAELPQPEGFIEKPPEPARFIELVERVARRTS
jgi:CheY-like chemotaxis protein